MHQSECQMLSSQQHTSSSCSQLACNLQLAAKKFCRFFRGKKNKQNEIPVFPRLLDHVILSKNNQPTIWDWRENRRFFWFDQSPSPSESRYGCSAIPGYSVSHRAVPCGTYSPVSCIPITSIESQIAHWLWQNKSPHNGATLSHFQPHMPST